MFLLKKTYFILIKSNTNMHIYICFFSFYMILLTYLRILLICVANVCHKRSKFFICDGTTQTWCLTYNPKFRAILHTVVDYATKCGFMLTYQGSNGSANHCLKLLFFSLQKAYII